MGQILRQAKELNLKFRVNHIPGKFNILADALSRASPIQTEWELNQGVFRTKLHRF